MTSSEQFTPSGGQTIFPRVNLLKTYDTRFAQRSENGRIFLSNVIVGPPAVITYGITSPGGEFNLRSTGTVDYEVEWELDGTREVSAENVLPHTYVAGDYELSVHSDTTYRPYINNNPDGDLITSVVIDAEADLGNDLERAWYGAGFMTSFACPSAVTGSVTTFREAWRGCTSLTGFPLIDTSSGANFNNAWYNCNTLTSFPLIDTSSGADFNSSWRGCSGLTSFPLIDTSSGTTFNRSWYNCTNLTSFPSIDASSVTTFSQSWYNCTSLTSFPLIDTSSVIACNSSWQGCSSLATFPANMFDTTGSLSSNAFNKSWNNCALTAQSIENILVSLDTNGQSNVSLGLNGGTNAAKTTWSTAAVTAYDNLIVKGWTINFNA